MIVKETPVRVNPCGLQVFVLLCSILVLPLALAVAQDYEAVERRLGKGVAKGELTLEQAAVMVEALQRTGGDDTVTRRTKATTSPAKLSEAEARARLRHAYAELVAKMADAELSRLEAAVKAGKNAHGAA